jgi:hypothetical protein
MLLNFLKKFLHLPVNAATSGDDISPRSWMSSEAAATRRRLQNARARRIEPPEVPAALRERSLSERFVQDQLAQQPKSTLAMAYWRHGESDQSVIFTGSKVNRKKTIAPAQMVANPGMGLDLECLTSFLSTSAKQRALSRYYVKAKDQISSSSYRSLSAASPIAAFEYGESQEVVYQYEECSQMSGAQEILYNMTRDPDVSVRESIAENENTPIEAMWILLEDESSDVRVKLAQNPKCAIPILEALCNDNDALVSTKAAKTMRRVWAEAGSGIANGNFEDEYASPELLSDAI